MNAWAVLAVGGGAAIGAWLRWGLGLALNGLWPTLPAGTLAANLLGGYMAGLALAWFSHHTQVPPEWRLLLVTGFLGGLTTFSSFSAEVVQLLQQGRLAWAGAAVGLHVAGSLLATVAGVLSVEALRRTPG
jgi:CrcB protein